MTSRILVASSLALMLSACTTTNPFTGQTQISSTAGGATIGAAAGAVTGLVAATATGGDARIAALIGAGVGALAGGAVGAYMDQQEAELRAQLQGTGVSVTRVGDQIILNMPSNITFDVGSATVKPQFASTLQSVALVLRRFDKTIVDVLGHTDSDGSEEYNLNLSRQRAIAVANIVAAQGIDPRRFYIDGRGESSPIASNATEAGKAQNRRVEIRIAPIKAAG
ncbi:MAG TPA: cell envelope biogenesis protein OmpA [Devosia sp.]|nr:cell envelope biogenesis protein OmpA [Devosia sp.]